MDCRAVHSEYGKFSCASVNKLYLGLLVWVKPSLWAQLSFTDHSCMVTLPRGHLEKWNGGGWRGGGGVLYTEGAYSFPKLGGVEECIVSPSGFLFQHWGGGSFSLFLSQPPAYSVTVTCLFRFPCTLLTRVHAVIANLLVFQSNLDFWDHLEGEWDELIR